MVNSAKKRVSKFDERTHYVIENKGSGKRTKPNEANFVGGKPLPAGSPDCSAKVPGFLWTNTKCRRVRDQVGATHYALPNLSKAHRACSETTGSACRLRPSSQEMKRPSPEFPMATQRLRNQPWYFARWRGECANRR